MQRDPRIIDSMPPIPSGYTNRFPLSELLKSRRDPMFDLVKDPKLIVEVGSCWGWFAYRAAVQCPEATIYCVDPWPTDEISVKRYKGGESNFWDWSLNVEPWLGDRVFGLRGVSDDFIRVFKDASVDLCFIDADHFADSVYSDCMNWWPKIKKGGFLIGHDIEGQWRHTVSLGLKKAFGKDYKIERNYWGMACGRKLGKCWVKEK